MAINEKSPRLRAPIVYSLVNHLAKRFFIAV